MTTPRRVLYVVRPAQGGIRQHVLNLLAHMDRTRFSLAVAAPAEFLESVATDGLSGRFALSIPPAFSTARDLAAAARLVPLVHQADLVHAHGLRAGWIAMLAHLRRSFPFVLTAHNLVRPSSRPMRLALGLIGRRASRVIAVSEATAAGLTASGVPRAKIQVIPNGIDLTPFARMPPVAEARQALAVAEDDFVVGCIARLSPEKGVDVLLRAAALTPQMTYLIAGDGPDRERLQRDAPPNVRLLGRIADTRALLAAADVLAIPSRQEGQGIVALEAMAAGTPVVASRVGGLAEMLADGGTALLAPPGDAGLLAAALSRLREDAGLRRQLAGQAEPQVRERYQLSQMVAATEAIYDSLKPDTRPLA